MQSVRSFAYNNNNINNNNNNNNINKYDEPHTDTKNTLRRFIYKYRSNNFLKWN